MRKKHFDALAAALRASSPRGQIVNYQQWSRDVLAVSNALGAMCPRFDPDRWLLAVIQVQHNLADVPLLEVLRTSKP